MLSSIFIPTPYSDVTLPTSIHAILLYVVTLWSIFIHVLPMDVILPPTCILNEPLNTLSSIFIPTPLSDETLPTSIHAILLYVVTLWSIFIPTPLYDTTLPLTSILGLLAFDVTLPLIFIPVL